jgi:methyltransferase (TIGR00027 family)
VENEDVSRTAIQVAMRRAAHLLLDADPKILIDRFASQLAGFASDQELLAGYRSLPLADVPWMRTPFVLRDRYTEDQLAQAFQKGIAQCVILGAGLNSFAYRQPEGMLGLQVFEVDHPATQTWKRRRVAELELVVPATLHYAPVDFEKETLIDGLLRTSFNQEAPAFFSWLGVTQYLTQPAILRTLQDIVAVAAPGSELVIQFIAPAEALVDKEAALVTALAEGAARVGEPWLTFFKPVDLEKHLRRIGLEEIVHFGADEASTSYLAERTDGLRLPAYFRMIKARMPL